MKLSEMSTERFAECLCELASPLSAIAQDENVVNAIDKITHLDTKKPLIVVFGQMITAVIPTLIKEHRDDVFAVLAALTGKTPKQLAAQNGLQTIKEARECIDREFIDFFTSAASQRRTES